jgi:hypothetical protein
LRREDEDFYSLRAGDDVWDYFVWLAKDVDEGDKQLLDTYFLGSLGSAIELEGGLRAVSLSFNDVAERLDMSPSHVKFTVNKALVLVSGRLEAMKADSCDDI